MERLNINSFNEKLDYYKSNCKYTDVMIKSVSYNIYDLELLNYSISTVVERYNKNVYEVANIIRINNYIQVFYVNIDPKILSHLLAVDEIYENQINSTNYVYMLYTDQIRLVYCNKEKDTDLYVTYGNYIKEQVRPIVKVLQDYLVLF